MNNLIIILYALVFNHTFLLMPGFRSNAAGRSREDFAVQTLKTGAQACVMKNNFARLAPGLERELQEVARRRQAEERRSLEGTVLGRDVLLYPIRLSGKKDS